MLHHKWYIDDGVVTGPTRDVARVVAIMKQLRPSLSLFMNDSKCELLFILNYFPPAMKKNLELLGAPPPPHRKLHFHATFVSDLLSKAPVLLSRLQQVGTIDPQVAYLLLQQLLQTSTPGSINYPFYGGRCSIDLLDLDVHRSFTECTSSVYPDTAWHQAQLSLAGEHPHKV